ncbi:MAG: twin-arginine translocase TatA/TatE family subunit [Eggerthellaceae bacterium]|nr:twin-arginine translocase TatA/TatE family subunit [Eggerthellaceae bacterium]
MKILGMGVPELLIILAVILLIFGPKNLPKLGSALGKTVKNLREGIGGGKEEAMEQVEEETAASKPVAAIEDGDDEQPARKKVRRVSTSA